MIRVLLVDDEPDLAELAQGFLQSGGKMKVELASSAQEAMSMMQGTSFDAIVSDYQMPKMDGIQFLRSIRARNDPIPFILFTGRGRESVVIDALNSGADFYLQKGGEPHSQFVELSHKIEAAVQKRRADEALRESEERYYSLFHRSLDCMYVHDLQGKILDANAPMLRLIGYEMKELSQLNIMDVLDSEGHERAREALKMITQRGSHDGFFDFRLRCKDGTFVEIETKGSLVVHMGKASAVLGIARDITKRKAEEAALQERERMYTMLQEHSGIGVGYYDLQGRLLFMNSLAAQHLNGSPSDFIGRTIMDIFGAEAGAFYFDRIRKASMSDVPMEYEDLVPLPGRTAYFISVFTRVLDAQDRILGVQIFSHDITQRREMEESLKKSERQYRSVTENAIEGIVVAQDGIIKYANPIIVNMIQLSAEEAVGMPFMRFIFPEDARLVAERYGKRIRGEDVPSRYDFRVLGEKGKLTWVSLSVIGIQWEGRPATLNFLMDITERKSVEQDLLQANQRLQLLGSITRHDALNQALVIEGNADLLDRKELTPDQKQHVAKIKRAAQTLHREMEFAKAYQEIGSRDPVWQDLRGCIEEARRSLDLGRLELIDLVERIEVYADPMLGKVFFNLIDNCLRHSGGAAKMTIGTMMRDGDLVVVAEDDGKGIDPDYRDALFEPGRGRNHGYGLYLIKEILSITGIGIVENSAPGQGARFEISVPAAQWRQLPE
jgi:PAS domain S-box-containing protein